MMKRSIVLSLLALTGCAMVSNQSKDLIRTRNAVSFSIVNSPDMTGYYYGPRTLGTLSAWCSMSKGDVLVADATSAQTLKISGFPKDYGHVVAAGWERDKRFFVHLTPGADMGTVIYCDLKKKEVTEVKHWAAW